MFKIFSLIIEHWLVIMLVILLVGSVVAFLVPAVGKVIWKALVGLATLALIYKIGRRDESKAAKRKAEIINEKRKKAYNEIDSHRPTHDDLVERLRNNGF